jgi:hypothetical protein
MSNDSELFKKLVNDEYFSSIDVQPISKQTELVLGNFYYIKYYFNDVVETVDEDGDIIEIPQVDKKEFGTLIPNPNSYNSPTAPYLFNIKYRWVVNKGFTTVNPGGTVDVNGRRLRQDNHESIYYDMTSYKPQSMRYMIYDINLIKQKINSLKNNAKLNVVGKFTADNPENTATNKVLTNPDMKSYISNFGGKSKKTRKYRKTKKNKKTKKRRTIRRKYFKYKK